MFKTKEIKELEEKLYTKVASEIQEGTIDQGTWARALAESNGVREKAEAKYIQLRVFKLKEKSIEDYNTRQNEASVRRKQEIEVEKDNVAVTIVRTVAMKNSLRFKYFSVALFVIGALSLFISALTDRNASPEDSVYFTLFLFTGIVAVLVSIYTFYESHKIEKITDVKVLYKKITRLFWIMIPTSIIVTLVGSVTVIVGLLAFIAFIRMCTDAYRFGSAYQRVVSKNLI